MFLAANVVIEICSIDEIIGQFKENLLYPKKCLFPWQWQRDPALKSVLILSYGNFVPYSSTDLYINKFLFCDENKRNKPNV